MNSFSLALIKNNNLKFEKKIFTVDDLREIISDYIELHEVTPNTTMDFVVDSINLTPEMIGDTSLSYETDKIIYQICHLDNEQNEKDLEINSLATYLAQNNKIFGNAVLIASNIDDNGLCSTRSITIDDICYVLQKNIVHTGLKVSVNGDVKEFQYLTDPFEDYSPEEAKNYKWVDISLFKFNLLFFIQIDPKEGNVVNKKATKLYGTEKINGDVIIVSQADNGHFLDLNENIFNKLYNISGGPLSNRELTEDEDKEDEVDGLPVIVNRYSILENRFQNYTKNCDNCKEKINEVQDSFVCTGCYRVIYDKEGCQKDNWDKHKNECLFKKEPINNKLNFVTESN